MACALISRSDAGAIGLGEFEVRNAARPFCDEPIDFRLERTRVDLEQQLAFLHARAIREGNAIDIAADSRTDIHRVHGLQTTAEFLPFAQRPMNHLGHRDLRQRGGRGGLRSGARVSNAWRAAERRRGR